MIGIVDSEIRIVGADNSVKDYCKNRLTLSNPDYEKKRRMGMWVGNTPKTIKFYYTDGDDYIVPFGCLKDMVSIIGKSNFEIRLPKHSTIEGWGNSVPLYDYQQEAVDNMIKAHYGILQSKAGSGKTQMGIAMAQKIGKKCLWITHTLDLLNQSKARAEQYMPKNTLGTIASGKVAIGSHITFATVQTLSKLNLNEFKYMWDCIIVDECHRCCSTVNEATMFGKVLNSLSARHKYGLSATVHRADGLIQGCFALLGNVAYRVPDEAIADKVMEVEVNTIYTGTKLTYEYLNFDGTIKWNRLIDCLVDNDERNELIVDSLEDRPTLILSCRLEHLEALRSMLPRDKLDKSAFISGKMTTKKGRIEREQAIEDMRTGKKQYLFATYQLAKEGLDIPRLERLLLTTPEKDYAVIVQSIGRVARVCEGKDKPYVLDFVDDVKTLYRKYKERCRIYKKENVKINE